MLETVISASCNRVPMLDAHLVCVSVSFAHKPSLSDIQAAWANYQPHEMARSLPSVPNPVVTYSDGADRPQPRRDRDAGQGMTTTVGPLRECPILDYKFVALSHNTIRGVAGGASLNAALVGSQGYVQMPTALAESAR